MATDPCGIDAPIRGEVWVTGRVDRPVWGMGWQRRTPRVVCPAGRGGTSSFPWACSQNLAAPPANIARPKRAKRTRWGPSDQNAARPRTTFPTARTPHARDERVRERIPWILPPDLGPIGIVPGKGTRRGGAQSGSTTAPAGKTPRGAWRYPGKIPSRNQSALGTWASDSANGTEGETPR